MTKKSNKTLVGAYTWAIVGFILGYWGGHRHYLRHHITGFLLSALLLSGFVVILYTYVTAAIAVLQSAASSLQGGATDFNDLDSMMSVMTETEIPLLGILLIAAAGLWWFIDLIIMKRLLDDYNKKTSN